MRFTSRFICHTTHQLANWLLPAMCILCGRRAHPYSHLCAACQQDLPSLSHACRQCAAFLPASPHIDMLCGACLHQPPPFEHTHALFPYETPITQLIIQLKFQHKLSLTQTFGYLLAEKIAREWYQDKPLPDLIIPIPLHPLRLRERGFNQALEIGRPVSKRLAIPLDINGTRRIKHTAAQSGLTALERQQNIAHAFEITRNYKGLSVAVLDDVVTTGHTMREFCRALKAHGAKHIDVWCCARRS